MRISTSLIYQRGVDAINNQQSEMSQTQEQLATGERLRSPADDPFAATRINTLDEQSSRFDQYVRNSGFAKSRLELEEAALTSSINALQRLRELAVQMANDTYSADDRISVSYEATQIRDALYQYANSTDEDGEFIFSGNKGQTQAFLADGNGNYDYQGDQGQRYIQIGNSRTVPTGDSGYEVFENIQNGRNVIEIAGDFSANLAAGNKDATAIAAIDESINRLSRIRSSIGARVNIIDSEVSSLDTVGLIIDKNRSDLKDLDYADAVSRFQQQLAGLQAAQQSFVQVQGLSLFNYI